MKIYIGFSKPTSKFPIFGWIIQWVERREYDHAYTRLPEPMDQTQMIFQASKEMANLYGVPNFLKENRPIKEYVLECDEATYRVIWQFAMAKLGTKYSVLQTFGILLKKVFRIHQPFKTEDEFCSKLTAQVCIILKVQIPEEIDEVTPSDLDQILSDNKVECVLNPTI